MAQVELVNRLGERTTEILRPVIGVEYRFRAQVMIARRHTQGVDDQLRAHVLGDRVPDAFFGAAVDNGRQVSESFPSGQVRIMCSCT
jgi:hypothetical protein